MIVDITLSCRLRRFPCCWDEAPFDTHQCDYHDPFMWLLYHDIVPEEPPAFRVLKWKG